MVRLVLVLIAIFVVFFIILSDKKGSEESLDTYKNNGYEKNRIITFDIHKIKGDLLNISRRSFRNGLKDALENSLKYKLTYNPNIKIVINIKEISKNIQKDTVTKNEKRYYILKKRVVVEVEYALFKNSRVTYYIDKLRYKAYIKADSYISFDDALRKIDKRLYWLVAKQVSYKLIDNYSAILNRVR